MFGIFFINNEFTFGNFYISLQLLVIIRIRIRSISIMISIFFFALGFSFTNADGIFGFLPLFFFDFNFGSPKKSKMELGKKKRSQNFTIFSYYFVWVEASFIFSRPNSNLLQLKHSNYRYIRLMWLNENKFLEMDYKTKKIIKRIYEKGSTLKICIRLMKYKEYSRNW